MSDKPKKVREKIGDIFQVDLGDGIFGYGQVVSKVEYAFFDFFNEGSIPNFSDVINSNILFGISVDRYVLRDGLWPIIGRFSVSEVAMKKQSFFTHDRFTNEYTIWTQEGKYPATPEEIQDLECLASWGHDHVEQRLRDHLAGRPNCIVERFRNLHNPNFETDIVKFYKQYGYDFKFEGED